MRRTSQTLMLAVAAVAASLALFGCSAPRPATYEPITVEGQVSARGSEPSAEYVLETDDGRLYVLELPEGERSAFAAPMRMRVTGRLYRDQWDSRPFAFIDVQTWDVQR